MQTFGYYGKKCLKYVIKHRAVCFFQRHVLKAMRHVAISAAVDWHMSHSEDVYCKII